MSRIALLTSVSDRTPWADMTTPNQAEYCRRHGYSFIARNLPYVEAVRDFDFVGAMLSHFDVVWCLDADVVIANMTIRVEDIPLKPGMNVCEEGLFPECQINCGSVMWTSSPQSIGMLRRLHETEPEWSGMRWIWQQWIAEWLESPARMDDPLADAVTVHPVGLFNSCQHGDRTTFSCGVYTFHPCGEPSEKRSKIIREFLPQVIR